MLRDAANYDDAVAVLRDTLRTSGASSRIYTELGWSTWPRSVPTWPRWC